MKLRLYGKKPFIIAVVHGGPGARGSVALVAKEMSQYFGVLEPLQTKTTVEGQVDELFNESKISFTLPISPLSRRTLIPCGCVREFVSMR